MELKSLFKNKNDQPRKTPSLLEITSPRTGERTMLTVENLLGSIAVAEPFSLETAGSTDGVSFMARCHDEDVLRGQIGAHYPQARIREVEPDEDPLRLDEGEQAWTTTLRSAGPEYVPLRTFHDRDLTEPGSDPLLAVLGAHSDLNDGERVVTRLRMRSLGPDWAVQHQQLAHERPAAPPPSAHAPQTATGGGLGMIVLALGALIAFTGYNWVQEGETLKAVLMGLGLAALLAAGLWVKARFFKKPRVYAPALVAEKTSRMAFDAEITVAVILPPGGKLERAEAIMKRISAAYRHYDNPAGASFAFSGTQPADFLDTSLEPAPRGFFGRRSVIGVREAAALWHPPGPSDDVPLVERSDARALMPSPRAVRTGAPVGETTAGKVRTIHFSDDVTRLNHLYVARTRMGKSTLMHHVVLHRIREKAAGRGHDAIIVVDPHADLVAGLLEHVPEELIPHVRLIDLADTSGAVGINVLDARIFTDRDRTADAVVRIAKGLWEQWGPRMQSILEHTVKTLHEANAHPDADPAAQYTILDGLRLVSEAGFRERVLRRVSDIYLKDWWNRIFKGWNYETRADALAPVQTRLSYYASSIRARAILGQPRSTIDIRRTILDGGILLVSTAQGAVGRDVSALVGSSILNLVDAVIREQGALPPEHRRGALVVVDEMQSMPGADYESMLSELGKFGASFILATQSLAKLDDLSRTMRDTVLANVGCLAVFQVAGSDARQLVWELGKDSVTEDDVTSLPAHCCYVRATVDRKREPAYSMKVLEPQPGDPDAAASVRAATAAYVTPAEVIAAEEAKRQRRAPRPRPNPPSPKDAAGQKADVDPSDGPERSRPRNPTPEQQAEQEDAA